MENFEFEFLVLDALKFFKDATSSSFRVEEKTLQQMLDTAKDLRLKIPDSINRESVSSTLNTIISSLETVIKLRSNQQPKTSVKRRNSNEEDNKMDVDSQDNKLDTFAEGRKAALESTIITDFSSLPLLSDIAGLKEAKDALLEALVDPILYPEWFADSNILPWRCILLYGPPGTGKSALCGAIAREVGARYYSISSSDLISSWSGQSERLIKTLFDIVIEQKSPSIIFLDEVDSLCRKRSNNEEDSNRRVKTELLVQLSRLQSASSAFLIAATNCPWELDPAFLRRFEKKIYIGLPDKEARMALFSRLLNKTRMSSDVSWTWLADETEGHSGDDIRRLCTEISFLQFRLYKDDKRVKGASACATPLTRPLLSPLLASSKPAVSHEHIAQFEAYHTKPS